MADLPAYVTVLLDGHSEKFDPGVVESQMEKGLSKLRVSQSRVVVEQTAQLLFSSAAETVAFETWYFNTIKRIGWFTIHDPRVNAPRTVRFKGGDIGVLEPLTGAYEASQRTVVLEYLR
jgi:hypothetical protein